MTDACAGVLGAVFEGGVAGQTVLNVSSKRESETQLAQERHAPSSTAGFGSKAAFLGVATAPDETV